MLDHSKMKLGRKAIKTDTRTLKLANYLQAALPPPPPSADWTKGITGWGEMLNDQLGDCTIAGAGHAIQVWTANIGSIVTVPDSTIEAMYAKWDGYVPGDASTDTGGVELDVLNDWRQQGLGGHTLVAFADPAYTNMVEIRQSIALFGGVYIGLALPSPHKIRTCGMWLPMAARTPKKAVGAVTVSMCLNTMTVGSPASPGAS